MTPDGSHRVACERDVAEFLQRRQASGTWILAALDPFLDAEGQMAANLVVEVVLVGPHVHHASDRRASTALIREAFLAGR